MSLGDNEQPEVRDKIDALENEGDADAVDAPQNAPVPQQRQAFGPPRVRLKYFFSVECPLDSTNPSPIEIPGGMRVQLSYLPDQSRVFVDEKKFRESWMAPPNLDVAVPTDDDRREVTQSLSDRSRPGLRPKLLKIEARHRQELQAAGLVWPGIRGRVLSGGDSLLVREDGVAVFDGRFTVCDESGFLIGAQASGVVDLRTSLGVASGPEAYAAYRKQHLAAGDPFPAGGIPIRLSLRFEASSGPGDADEFAADRYVLQTLGHPKFEPLVRGQFLGLGTLAVKKAPHWPVEKILLHVYAIDSHVAEEAQRKWKN